jgi:hypothetical protein
MIFDVDAFCRREWRKIRMVIRIALLLAFLALPCAAQADENTDVAPLPCGIYDQAARPLVEKDLATQSLDPPSYTMAITTKLGKRLKVTVQNVLIRLAGERNHVSVFLDGKPYAKTSHQDLPVYLEVTIDDVKYRIICQHRGQTYTGIDPFNAPERALAGPLQ